MAVYDLGGDSFSAAGCAAPRTARAAGPARGIERLGGGTFDEALLSHVNQATGGPLAGLDRRDPEHAAAVAGLRRNCATAKQELSTEGATTIRVLLPNRQADVAVTRPEFEQLIRTSIETTIGALLKALQSAGVEPREVAAVAAVGGSSQIPVGPDGLRGTGRPIMLDPDPKRTVTMGAATRRSGPDTRPRPRRPRPRKRGYDRTAELPNPPAPARSPTGCSERCWKEPAAVPVQGPSGGRGASGRGRHRERSAAGAPPRSSSRRAVRSDRSMSRRSRRRRRSRWRSPPRPRPRRSPAGSGAGPVTAELPAGDTTVSPRRTRAPPASSRRPDRGRLTRTVHPRTPTHPPSGPPEPSWPPPPRLRAPAPAAAGGAGRAGPGRRAGRDRLRGRTLVPSAAPVPRRPHTEPSRPTRPARPRAHPASAPPCRSGTRPASSSSAGRPARLVANQAAGGHGGRHRHKHGGRRVPVRTVRRSTGLLPAAGASTSASGTGAHRGRGRRVDPHQPVPGHLPVPPALPVPVTPDGSGSTCPTTTPGPSR